MCGIIGAVAERNVVPILLEGLKRLEYRGYDSAGVAVLDQSQSLRRVRTPGKVERLNEMLEQERLEGITGIAHTRWATHGKPSQANAHPHVCRKSVALVHNGIIENFEDLRTRQIDGGYEFTSETDTEVVVHQVYGHLQQNGGDLLEAVRATVADLQGAYALGVISIEEPGTLVAARRGSPLAIGVGIGEYFIASDISALIPVTQRFVFLEDGDIARLTKDGLVIYGKDGNVVQRPMQVSELTAQAMERGQYRHYVLKEIFEQSHALAETIEGRVTDNNTVLERAFGPGAGEIFDRVDAVQIIACGTSYHAGLVARYWLEAYAGVPCNVEIASEFRYRAPVVRPNSLVVAISQSGETADTLAALREAKRLGFGPSLAICNVPESLLVRETDLSLMTRAGPEISVASTKAFTTQLASLMLLVIALGRRHKITPDREAYLVQQLKALPGQVDKALELNAQIEVLSRQFAAKQHALFLGRGAQYPVAMEGALKLKEISYIHAEAYPAGELKHGPLALVDADMPVIAVAPNNELLEKLKSNLQEVRARGGELIVFADASAHITPSPGVQVLGVPPVEDCLAPVVYTVPLQLLAYHAAVIKGTDVDQPRNLAKAVTVE